MTQIQQLGFLANNLTVNTTTNTATFSNILVVGNSTVNVVINSSSVYVSGSPLSGSINTSASYTWSNTNIYTANVSVNGAIIANGSIGTFGQVLTSSAGGNVYWSTVSGGGSGGFSNGQSISVANLAITGSLTAANSVGTSGQALISTGNGVQWSTVSPTYNFSSQFDGSSYFSVPSPSGGILDLTNASVFTIEAWVWINAFSAGENAIINTRPVSPAAGYDLRINTTGTVQFYFTGGSSLTTTATLTTGRWYHIAVVRSSTTNISIYIDGVSSATVTNFANGTATSQACWIGSSTGASTNHNGFISNLRVVKGTAVYTGNFTVPTSPLSAITNTTLLTCTAITPSDSSSNNLVVTNNGVTGTAINSPFSSLVISPVSTNYIRQQYTANGTANTFTVTSGYSPNNLDVYVNGIKLYNGTDVNVSNGTTFTILGNNPINGSIIEVVGLKVTGGASVSSYNRTSITATAGQTTFNATYTVGYVQVFLNGVLLNNADYTATSGSTIVLAFPAAAGDIIEVVNVGVFSSGSYTRTSYIATSNQTTFSATYSVNYIQVYVNGVLLDTLDYTATDGSSVVLAAGASAGDSVDIVSLNVSGFTGGVTTTGTPATGQLTSWTGTTSVRGFAPSAVGDIPFSANGTTFTTTQKIVQGTAVTLTTQTSVDFTGIPSWVKRITVMFQGVSTSSTSNKLMQLGTSSGVENTGYTSTSTALGAGITHATSTSGFLINSGGAAEVLSGIIVIDLISGTTFVLSGTLSSGSTASWIFNGYKTLASALTTFRLTTVNGTDTFDAGSVNIMYE